MCATCARRVQGFLAWFGWVKSHPQVRNISQYWDKGRPRGRTVSAWFIRNGPRGGTWTRTAKSHSILSAECLPIPPLSGVIFGILSPLRLPVSPPGLEWSSSLNEGEIIGRSSWLINALFWLLQNRELLAIIEAVDLIHRSMYGKGVLTNYGDISQWRLYPRLQSVE